MMKIFSICCVVVLVANIVNAQDATGSCADGFDIDGSANYTSVPCDFDDGETCQVKFETQVNVVIRFFSCEKPSICENNAANNPQNCYGQALDKPSRVCFFCCQEPDCNTSLLIPDPQE